MIYAVNKEKVIVVTSGPAAVPNLANLSLTLLLSPLLLAEFNTVCYKSINNNKNHDINAEILLNSRVE